MMVSSLDFPFALDISKLQLKFSEVIQILQANEKVTSEKKERIKKENQMENIDYKCE